MNIIDEKLKEDISYPWLIFKLKSSCCAINSKNISAISIMPKEIIGLPEVPQYMKGMIRLREAIVPTLDFRHLLNLPSRSSELEEFYFMLDQRKEDHRNWVQALDHSISTDTQFTLARDPHQCALGKWYDGFETDNHAVNYHLRKLQDPHEKLHKLAHELDTCSRDCSNCTREECLKETLRKAETVYMPMVLDLLEETKAVFASSYQDMVIVLEDGDGLVGIIVDEVLSVDDIEMMNTVTNNESHYICGIGKSNKIDSVILLVDESKLLETASEYRYI